MRASLFEVDQSVLLVGEGNFSFSVALANLNLNLKLISTCFEKTIVYSSTEENINLLNQKGVRVLVGVDATQLSQHEELCKQRFQRIVFNFPHVGGKTKIHLNRTLLRNFFISCSPLLAPDGAVIVSLCRGQGGSGFEDVPRRPADTWQAAEMAAHGEMVLVAVESWMLDSPLGCYSCVGRRSRDATFRREGALVHVFKPAPVSLPDMQSENTYLSLLQTQPIASSAGSFSRIENILLNKNLLARENSAPSYFLLNLVNTIKRRTGCCVEESSFSPVTIDGALHCHFFTKNNPLWEKKCLTELSDYDSRFHVLSGTVLKKRGCDLSKAPVACCAVVLGAEAPAICRSWLQELGCSIEWYKDILLEVEEKNACLLDLDHIAVILLKLTGWRELWATGAQVHVDSEGKLIWRPPSVYPPTFTFDLCAGSDIPPDVEAVSEVVWQLAGEMVEQLEVVDTYAAPEGWHSKCFRFTYRSYEMAFFRARVVEFHQFMVAPALVSCLGLSVK